MTWVWLAAPERGHSQGEHQERGKGAWESHQGLLQGLAWAWRGFHRQRGQSRADHPGKETGVIKGSGKVGRGGAPRSGRLGGWWVPYQRIRG